MMPPEQTQKPSSCAILIVRIRSSFFEVGRSGAPEGLGNLAVDLGLIDTYAGLIVPLLRSGEGMLADALVRRIVRFAWHATSVLMLVSA